MVGRSLARVEDAIDHLREFFGPDKAIEIPSDTATCVLARSIYRLEHIRTNSSGKVVAK